ncbi:MAG: response regulator [Chloroflexi bacterium]|nr:response regulator [Chloroflexota bacterium]
MTLTKTKADVQPSLPSPKYVAPARILVVDSPNGPADVLSDTLTRLLQRDLSFTNIPDQSTVLNQLGTQKYDLIFVGLDTHQRDRLFLVRYIRIAAPLTPIAVVTRQAEQCSPENCEKVKRFGAQELISLPRDTVELRGLMSKLNSLSVF